MRKQAVASVFVAILFAFGCSPQQVVDDASQAAEERAEEGAQQAEERTAEAADDLEAEAADRARGAVLAQIGPELIQEYVVGLMQVMFYTGGFYGDDFAYESGQYTVWGSDNSPYGGEMTRVLLKERDDGWQWWRLEVEGDDRTEGDDEMHVVIEALFEPGDESHFVRELFVRYPGEEEPAHIEVEEDEREYWQLETAAWTDEVQEDLYVDTAELEVPAGQFAAAHFLAEHSAEADEERDRTRTAWWMAEEEVPGSVVKIQQSDPNDDHEIQTLHLTSYGDGAGESKLGAFEADADDDAEAEADRPPRE